MTKDKFEKCIGYYKKNFSILENLEFPKTNLDNFLILLGGIAEDPDMLAHLMNFMSLYLAYDTESAVRLQISYNHYKSFIDSKREEIDKI